MKWWLLIQFDEVLSLVKVYEYLGKSGWNHRVSAAFEQFPILTHTTGVLFVVASNSMFLKSSSFVMIMC